MDSVQSILEKRRDQAAAELAAWMKFQGRGEPSTPVAKPARQAAKADKPKRVVSEKTRAKMRASHAARKAAKQSAEFFAE
jgi:hypothetical protein